MENIENVQTQENVESQQTQEPQTKPKKKFDWKKFVKWANRVLIAVAIMIFMVRLPVACVESETRKYDRVSIDDFNIVAQSKSSPSANQVRVMFSIENDSGCDIESIYVDIDVYVNGNYIGSYSNVCFNLYYLADGDTTSKQIVFTSYDSKFHDAQNENVTFFFSNAQFYFAEDY